MYQYSKYINRHLIHATLLITFSITSIVWLTQALRFIDFIVNQGISVTLFLQLTMLLLPSLIMMILPPAFFCALIVTYNKMKMDSELVIMQAAGISKWRLAIPAIQVSVIVTLLTYSIALYVLPISYGKFKDMQSFLRNSYVSLLLQEGVFSNPVNGLTVFIRERDDDGILHGILVHDNRMIEDQITMMAEEAKLVQTEQGPRFLLKNGNRQEVQEGKLSFLTFDEYAMDISLYTKAIGKRHPDIRELYVHELLAPDPSISEREYKKRFAEAQQRIIWPAYPITLTLLATATLLSGQFNRRGNWQRVATIVIMGTLLLFVAVGMRGLVGKHDGYLILAYANLIIPALISIYVLLGGKWFQKKAKLAQLFDGGSTDKTQEEGA